jgi:hypothetical protein
MPNVKIRFKLDPENQQGHEVENLWAEPLADGTFRILNSPFFAFGVSFQDIVKAATDDNVLQFIGIARRGGHSTYRIFLQDEHTIHDPIFQQYWKPISASGATLENANDQFAAVDIPPGSDVAAIYRLLQEGENANVWAFEEGYFIGN